MSGLFISYRRADSAGWAGRLKDHLEARYGADLVWQVVDVMLLEQRGYFEKNQALALGALGQRVAADEALGRA